ncbi:uncharacterized protein [Penaeus vannamei]|uniref:uncharacterized protein isoform X2 n=1 Tax=Penaeus vannamei TaxID=6689 RepID=UPI00387F4E7C
MRLHYVPGGRLVEEALHLQLRSRRKHHSESDVPPGVAVLSLPRRNLLLPPVPRPLWRLSTRRPRPGLRGPTALVTARKPSPTRPTTTTTPLPAITPSPQSPTPSTTRFSIPTTTPTSTTPVPPPRSTTPTATTSPPQATTSTRTASPTTTSSPQGPATTSAFATNQVFQQRTGPPAVRPNIFPQFFADNQETEQQEFEPAETEVEPAEVEEPQEQEFIPFTGVQPQVSDLMPFLQRAGMNTQVIRTASLASVQGIINNLPVGLRPIVLFRSGSGHLTELDAQTLLPLRRVGRSTTTKLPNKEPSVLLTCDLDVSPCNIKPVGGVWSKGNTEAEGNFNQVQLNAGEGSQVVVQELVSAPTTDAICVGLSHWRSLLPEAELNGTLPDVQIGVMPLRGEVSRLPLAGASGVWEMSRVSFNNITTPFQMLLTLGPTMDASKVAVDALQVTDGSCCMSGEC